MRKRLRIAIIMMGFALISGLAWEVFYLREPSYAGKPLSFWLYDYNELPTDDSISSKYTADEKQKNWLNLERDRNAILSIGTNGIPVLLEFLRANDSMATEIIAMILGPKYFPHHSDHYYHALAAAGFDILGASGRDAVPQLVDLLKNPDIDIRLTAAGCLGSIGPDAQLAVPDLVQFIGHTGHFDQSVAISTLGQIHMKPELVIPALVDKLSTSNSVQIEIIQTIGMYGGQAKSAAPTIVKSLEDKDADVRSEAAATLKKIDPELAAKTVKN